MFRHAELDSASYIFDKIRKREFGIANQVRNDVDFNVNISIELVKISVICG